MNAILDLYSGEQDTFDLFLNETQWSLSFSESFSYMVPVKDDGISWYIHADNCSLFCDMTSRKYHISSGESPQARHIFTTMILSKETARQLRVLLDKVIEKSQEQFPEEQLSSSVRNYQPPSRAKPVRVKDISLPSKTKI